MFPVRQPFSWTTLDVVRTLIAANQWVSVGWCMNLLSTPTTKVISDLVTVRYINFPINLLYLPGSIVWLSSNHKFTLASIRVLAGLHLKSPAFSRSYRAYFQLKRSTLCFWCATLIPKKYLGRSMSLVIKWRLRYSFVANSPTESLSVSKMSSIYTVRTIMPDFVHWTKIQWSEWH